MGLEQYRINQETLTFYEDSNGEKLGKPIGLVDRQEGIDKGLLLEGVQLWVVNPDNNQVLMQRRSKKKRNNPNKIDVSVSGHVGKNESPLQAMLREANEEMGIDREWLCAHMQKFTDTKINLADFGRQGRYVVHLYLTFSRCPLEHYRIQEDEVEEIFFMDYEEIKRRVKSGDPEMLMPNSDESERIFSILDDLIFNKNKNVEEQQI